MVQRILTPSVIAKEAMFQLENNLVMGNLVHRDYRKEFVKVGETVSIRKPVKFTVTDGATRTNQDVEEGSTSITIDKRKHVSFNFSSQDETLSIEEYSYRYIKPASIVLANQVDRDVLDLYKQVWNWVGTPGNTINSFADLALGPQRLDEMAVPAGQRYAVMGPADSWGMVGNLTGLSLEGPGSNNASVDAYRAARLGRVANLETYQDQNVRRHTVGAHAGTPLSDGAGQQVAYSAALTSYQQSFVTDGWDASIVLKAGDVFTVDTVFAVNPVSKDALDFLQEFVLVSDVTTNATTTADTTLTISPPMITTGPYQTVSVTTVPDGATIVYKGTLSTAYPQNMVFHKNAFALVTVPLEMPSSIGWKARRTHKGLSVRLVKDYDIDNDVEIIRADIMYGVKAIYPELATRISGSA
ncbi:hypothetical protein LCGC14_2508260 [marine sediment metagenome]|uniref:Uncharacterized protein n=1 Tax=marine sediment metagenome TaxID=412755 RepID=A0A0F9BMT3_9ZZZZ